MIPPLSKIQGGIFMKATFSDFLTENSMCNGFANNQDAKKIFEILSEDESIFLMIDSAELGRPSLEPCIEKIEKWYDENQNCQIDFADEFTRKAVGRMVKTILDPFGYEVSGRKSLSKQTGLRFFKTASCYQKTGEVKLKVIRQIVEA